MTPWYGQWTKPGSLYQIRWKNSLEHKGLRQYSKTCVKWPLSKRPKIGFQDQLSLHAGQKYCRMLQGEHSAILLTFIKLPFVIKIFVLSIFEWPFYTGCTVYLNLESLTCDSSICTMDNNSLIVSNQMEEFIRIQRVKTKPTLYRY